MRSNSFPQIPQIPNVLDYNHSEFMIGRIHLTLTPTHKLIILLKVWIYLTVLRNNRAVGNFRYSSVNRASVHQIFYLLDMEKMGFPACSVSKKKKKSHLRWRPITHHITAADITNRERCVTPKWLANIIFRLPAHRSSWFCINGQLPCQ